MKIRTGFVSNSSSSSFVIDKKNLSTLQIEQIYNHIELGKRWGLEWADTSDAWHITETDETIAGSTMMTNFDIYELLNMIGVDEQYITVEEY
jgi:hypothetical protein